MTRSRGTPTLATYAAGGSSVERTLSLIALGRYDDADVALQAVADGCPRQPELEARLHAARGEFLLALSSVSDPESPPGRRLRASILGHLGRTDEALTLLDRFEEPLMRLTRGYLYLQAGEPAPAAVSLPEEAPRSPPGDPGDGADVDELLAGIELPLARGEVEAESGLARTALPLLYAARAAARAAGAVSLEARAEARIGECHGALGDRWRALRRVTRSLDLAAAGGVEASALPGIHLRAFLIYARYGHRERANAAVDRGHHLVVQLASGIDQHDLREGFFLDNRDVRRLVSAWKGDASWGAALRP